MLMITSQSHLKKWTLLNAIESRLNRLETFKKEYHSTLEGLTEFMDEVSGIEELEKLSKDRKVRNYKKERKSVSRR